MMRLSSNTLFIVLLLTLMSLTSCVDELSQQNLTKGEQVIPPELAIKNIGENIATPVTTKFKEDVDGVISSLNQMCTSLESRTSLSSDEAKELRLPAQAAWKKAMTTYHHLEMLQFGPVKNDTSIVMKNLYTFSASTKCPIELLLKRSRMPSLKPTDDNGYKLIGLDALEHLLFIDPEESLCTRQRPNSWFTTNELPKRQKDICQYMQHIAGDLKTQATELNNEWSSKDYTGALLVKNIKGSTQEALSHISQALFFLYGEVADLKIATPAGIELFNERVVNGRGCTTPCPQKAEHPYARFSIDAIIASLDGFSWLFNGISPYTQNNRISFDDLISARGFSQIVTEMNQLVDHARTNLVRLKNEGKDIADLAKLVETKECIQSGPRSSKELCAIYQDIGAITDKLQEAQVVLTDLLTAPTAQQGDND